MDIQGTAGYRDAATQALLERLGRIAAAGKTLFGMANANTLTYKGRLGPEVSDCQAVTGAHPAFVEDDFMWYSSTDPNWQAGVTRERHLAALRAAHGRGAVCGFCWHLAGKDSGSFRYRTERGPGAGEVGADGRLAAALVARYRELKALAGAAWPDRLGGGAAAPGSPTAGDGALEWFCGLVDSLVIPILRELGFPLVFRPFHEMNGNWFWWGSEALGPAEYRDLYRLVVEYLRFRGVRNLIYAWSPNTPFGDDWYPGDGYVDVLGLDSYEPGVGPGNDHRQFVADLQALGALAARHGKLAALCETGCRMEGGRHRYPGQVPDFWSRCVLGGIKAAGVPLVWAMSWYQRDWSRRGESQYYIPYPGIETEQADGALALEDFRRFARDPAILLEDGLAGW